MDLSKTINQIIEHSYFLRLRNIVENIQGWHDHETVYDHLIKTMQIAKKAREGEFIKEKNTRQLFIELMAIDIQGIKLRDIVVLTALLHDCGKILSFSEGGNIKEINMKKNNGQTSCPGHEYWGGKLVAPEILKDIDLPQGAKQFISECIKVHDTFSKPFFQPKKAWALQEIIYDIKSKANGYYEEALFNIYCDCNTSPAFADEIAIIEKIFSEPSFYIKRKYFLT